MIVIAAPSNLGLRPLRPGHEPGTWRAPAALFEAGLLDVFDTLHLFSGGKWSANSPTGQGNAQVRAITDQYNKAHPGAGRLWIAGVIPGWDERLLTERPEKKHFDRRDGALYEESWQGALATNPDLVTITSWNEWYESTAIEPSVRNQTKYLDLTRLWTARYKGTGTPAQPTAAGVRSTARMPASS